MPFDSSSNGPDEPVSKSQRKREAHALLALGRRLVELRPAQLASVPLPQQLREAVEGAQRITQHGARKRELGFIGKLMREVDPEPIEEALARIDAPGIVERARQHRLELWRDALIDRGDPLILYLAESNPAADRQPIRQLVIKARSEAEQNKTPAAARQLFKLLRKIDKAEALPEAPPEG